MDKLITRHQGASGIDDALKIVKRDDDSYVISTQQDEEPKDNDHNPILCVIHFQSGPMKENGVNGITNEALLAILIDRITDLNQAPFNCRENSIAITHVEDALLRLQDRTRQRVARGVEGTSTV